MLPSNPRAGTRGLPSNPRSRSVGPSRQNARHSEDVEIPLSSSRQVKHQSTRSMASFPREASRNRPLQSLPREPSQSRPLPQSNRAGWQRKYSSQSSYDSEAPSRASQDSDSTSSSISSLFDRVRTGAAGYASSFTSFEDNSSTYVDDERRGRSLRKQGVASPESLPQETKRTDTGTGDGYTVWSRVAGAASSLTISVSKAWASNITMYAGEETPPGEESRLCRAMKAYHISKCQDRQDLPSWLFSESERIPRSRVRPPRSELEGAPKPSRPTIRDFPSSAPSIHQSISRDMEQTTPKTSTDRLRRLREAKRQAAAQAEQPSPSPRAYAEPRQKIGLPTGPAQRRR